MKHDKSAVMRRAHQIRKQHGVAMSAALKSAWSEAKAAKVVAIPPQRLPLEAAAMGAWALAKKLKGAKVEVALRVRIDAGLRVTPKGETPMAFVKQSDIAGGLELN